MSGLEGAGHGLHCPQLADWILSYRSLLPLAPPPNSPREAQNADRSELAGSADTALEARRQRGRCRRSRPRSNQKPDGIVPTSPAIGIWARSAERGSNVPIPRSNARSRPLPVTRPCPIATGQHRAKRTFNPLRRCGTLSLHRGLLVIVRPMSGIPRKPRV